MSDIVEVVKRDLDDKNVAPNVLESVPMYIRRAIVSLHNSGALPPRIKEFEVESVKEEKRDGNGNIIYEFFFLPDDFLRLDKFTVYREDTGDNRQEKTYQRVSSDMLFNKRNPNDDRNFFTIFDYHIGDERTRKALVLDPYPEEDNYIELRYFPDGTETPLENLNQRYWEPVIAKIHQLLGIKTVRQAEKEISKESANWRNQQGKDSFNKTHVKTSVKNGLWGKTK